MVKSNSSVDISNPTIRVGKADVTVVCRERGLEMVPQEVDVFSKRVLKCLQRKLSRREMER